MKYCKSCNQTKELSQFWKNKSAKDGYQAWCKPCWYDVTAKRRNGPKREIELRQRQNRHLIRTYGITINEYEKMSIRQNHLCAICKEVSDTNRKLVVDHDHITGDIRGLLCGRCNKSIGLFKDNTIYLNNAIKYLAK